MATETAAGDLPAEVIARLLNITTRRLQQLAKEGVIPKSETKGRYPLAGCVRGYIVFLQQTGGAENIDPDRLKPFERRAHYQAEIEKLDLGMRSGSLVPVAEVERTFARVFDVLARFLDVLPDRLERAGLADPRQAERIVEWSNAARVELHQQLTTEEAAPADPAANG